MEAVGGSGRVARMGSFNPARRMRRSGGRRIRRREPGRSPWEWRHHPWTIEGKLEGFARFSHGANLRRRQQRREGPGAGHRRIAAPLIAILIVALTLLALFVVLR